MAGSLNFKRKDDSAIGKIESECKAAGMLARLERRPGMRTDKRPAEPGCPVQLGSEYALALKEIGIDKHVYRRWHLEASIPPKLRQHYYDKTLKNPLGEITTLS